MLLTAENYSKGFLIDEELMGGVSEHPEQPGRFFAYVMNHGTGEYLGQQAFTTLDEALRAINSVQRAWAFEKTSGCGGCGNNEGGVCKKGGCGKGELSAGRAGGGCCGS